MRSFRERVDSVKAQIVDAWNDKDRDRANKRYEAIVAQTRGTFLASPEVLQAVAEVSPVKSDLFSVGRFFRTRKNESMLSKVITDNSTGYQPFLNAAQHTWSALIEDKVEVQEIEGDKPAWFDTHAKVMNAMTELPEFKELRERTAGSTLYTSAAMHTLLPVIRKLIDENLPPGQGGGDKGNEDGGDEGDGKGDGDQEADGDGKPNDGQGMTKKQMQDLLKQAMKDASDKNDKTDQAMKSCGMEPPTDQDMDPSAYMKLVKEFENNKNIQKLVNMVGRLGKIARAKSKRIIPGFAGYGINRFLGDELSRVPDYKLAELGVPALRKTFLLDLCGCELPQVTEHDNAPPGRGPVIVMSDESGSMQDGQMLIAKALSVASIRTAREHGRKAWAVSFSSDARFYDTQKPDQLVKFMHSNMAGGTDFDKPIQLGVQHITKCPQARQADMMLLTDGECDLSDEFAKRFAEWKYRTGARLFAVMIGGGGYSYGGSAGDKSNLRKVADYYLNIKNLTSEDDASKAFAEFWQHVSDTPITQEDLDERQAEADEAAAAAPQDAPKPLDFDPNAPKDEDEEDY
jgi:uncharacterized protein with von Willebrand factor type A (vWA) domain